MLIYFTEVRALAGQEYRPFGSSDLGRTYKCFLEIIEKEIWTASMKNK